MTRNKIQDNSLVNAIRQRNALYNQYTSPEWDYTTYRNEISNIAPDIAPDSFGVDDWFSNAYADWQKNRHSIMKDTALGDYVMADEDQTTIQQARDYMQLDRAIQNNLQSLQQDPYNQGIVQNINQLTKQRDSLRESYDKLLNGDLWDSSLNDRINSLIQAGDINNAIALMNQASLEDLQAKKDNAIQTANEAQDKVDEYDSKITSDYYRRKSQNPGMDLTELDTYLYKLPGLMGSSSATLLTDLGVMAGSMAAYALMGSGAGPIGTAVGAIAGAAITIGGNIYSRDKESKAEVYSNYKSKVQSIAKKEGIEDSILKDAKAQMRNSGIYTEDQINDDEFVYDQLLTGQVQINNTRFDKARVDNMEGLQSLYMDNMALSINDIAQTVLSVVPIGKIAKVTGLNKVGKAIAGSRPGRAINGFSKAVSDRVDDVAKFGLDNVNKLPRLTRRRNIIDLGGRVLVNTGLEGMEEGTQYIKGQRYIDNDFEADPNYLKSYLSNIGTGARSIFAALTPFDPVYSDDEEFMENFKGGALLGGLMTSVIGGISTINDTRKQTQADRLLSSVFSEKLDQEDRVRKDIMYSKALREGRWDNVEQAFDNLESLNIEGLDKADIQEERERANKLRNEASAPINLLHASMLGIDPRTEDYDIFIALKDHHTQLVAEADEKKEIADDRVMQLTTSQPVQQYISQLVDKVVTKYKQFDNPEAALQLQESLQNVILNKYRYDQLKAVVDDLNTQEQKLTNLEKNTGIRTSKADVIEYKHVLDKDLSEQEKEYQESLNYIHQAGLTDEELSIPAVHQDLQEAYRNQLYANMDLWRAQAENDIMTKLYRDGILSKIEKYKTAQIKSERFIQRLNDLASGKTEQKIVEDSEEVTPELEPNESVIPEQPQQQTETQPESEPTQDEINATLKEFNKQAAERIAKKRAEDNKEAIAARREEISNIISQHQQELEQQRINEQAQTRQNEETQNQPANKPITDNEAIPVTPIQNPNKVEPAKVEEPTLADIMGELAGDAARDAMNQPVQQAQPEAQSEVQPQAQEPTTIPQAEPLTYEPRLDPYSHQVPYRLTVPVTQQDGSTRWEPARYQGMEEYLNNDDFAEISAKSDFIDKTANTTEVIVRPYVNSRGETEDAIYVTFEYDGKKYAAAIQTVEYGLRRNFRGNRYSYEQQQYMESNLRKLRQKAIDLYEQVKKNPNLMVVPTTVRTTTGRVRNLKDANRDPVRRKLTDTVWSATKDPYQITPENTRVGVSTGGISGIIRNKQRVVSTRGTYMGAPYWEFQVPRRDGGFDTKIVQLNTKKLSNKAAEVILDLAISDSNTYTDASGLQTQMSPLNVLTFLVNFGPRTATNPNDYISVDNPYGRLSYSQVQKRIAKQFYVDENNNLIVGTNTYSISDIISSPEVRQQVVQYIADNFHYNVDELALTATYFGGGMQNPSKDHRFDGIEALLKSTGRDKLVIVPGEVELTLKDFGLMKDASGKVVDDPNLPKGISQLGWYIKEGIINTDIADELYDANIYIDDLQLVDRNRLQTATEAEKKVEQVAQESQVFDLPDTAGGRVKVDMADLYAILDGKKRQGPNMTTDTQEDPSLMQNQDKLNPEQATKWLQETLGITPEITQAVIDTTEAGQEVVGRATEDSILLSEQAPIGTEYHEAWHRVSQLVISEKERKNIYSKFNKKHGTNLTEAEIDEQLAEQFRDFMINESGNYDFRTKNWFRRIIDFIRLWVRTGQYGLARIYANINRGKYYGIQPNQQNIERFRKIYQEGPNMQINGVELKNITTIKQLNSITNSLTYAFFRTSFTDNNYLDYADINPAEFRFDRLKLIIEAQNYKYPNPVLQEVVDKFESVFVPRIVSNLKSLGIRAIDRDENQTISDIEEGAEGVKIGDHTIESMNISIKDNAPAEVKFFFQTIPAYIYDKDGQMIADIDQYTHFANFVDSRVAWVKILKDLHGCRNMTSMLNKVAMKAQQNDPFYQALLFKLSQLIQKSASSDPNEAVKAEATLTKIETVVTCDINNFVTVSIDKNRDNDEVTMSVKDNNVDIQAMSYPRIWSQYLFNNSQLFRYKDGQVVAYGDNTKHQLDTLIKNINKIRDAFIKYKGILDNNGKPVDLHTAANLDTLKDLVIQYLNTVGIGIDKATLNNMLTSGVYGNPSSGTYELMNNFMTSTANFGGMTKLVSVLNAIQSAIKKDGTVGQIKVNDQVLEPTQIWNELGFVKEIANFYSQTHATDRSLSHVGPDNATYYMVSQNNFAKDRVNELVNDPETVEQLNSVVYNQHSIVLDAINKGNKELQIETFINFKDNTSHDSGRDYFGITDREDYLAKMTAIFSDRIIFPTIADKKTYHFLKGIRLPHERIRFNVTPNGTYIKYGDEALNILLGYCEDELNRVELTLRQIDDDPNHVKIVDGKEVHVNEDGSINDDWLEPSRRIKNYHTPNKYKDENDKTHTIEGNGARFLFLTGVYTSKGFKSFNDPKKSARENLQNAKDWFFNMSDDTKKAMLSTILSKRIKEEIATAKGYGLITANQGNDIWSIRNELLDSNQVRERAQYYSSMDPNNAQGYAVFDMIADYTINSIISVNEVEKLFSGDPAYYKVQYSYNGPIDVSVDKIKRLSSLTSTGLNNRLDFSFDPIDSEYTVAELKDHEIADRQYFELERLFTRGSIKESVQELYGEPAWNDVKDMNIEDIRKVYPDAVEWAETAAKKDVEGYKSGINVADAAVYISPNMTRNLLRMRGVWSPEIKEAFEVLTNPETADTWESNPEQYAKANKVILNAMKYVAFGTRFDEIPGLGIPYFNKMALFPLFKSIATGDMKALYDRMVDENNPIDMVLFNSAVKAGSRDPQKTYRQAKDSEIELKDGQTVLSAELTESLTLDREFKQGNFNLLTTYKQKYKYIRQQLETNPHTHEEQMLGTQFMKVNLSNLRMGDMYGREGDQVTGQEIVDTIMNGLNELSNRARQRMESELTNEDGTVNQNKLRFDIRQSAVDSDMDDNVISGLSNPNTPLDAISNNKFLESRYISKINKEIVDVHMPGGAFIQRSAFGLEATSMQVISDKMVNNGKALLSINETDGSMDSVVSINLFKHIIPGYSKMTFTQARQWLLDHNIIGQNAEATAIGYRIPTQSVASISALRFVDVFPEIMGDTIMLPESFTKQTGSDFDIDKLYVARYGFDKEGKIIHDESDASIKNDMLKAYIRVLLTKDNMQQLRGSIDTATEDVRAVLRDIEGSQSSQVVEPMSVYTPTYQEARKAEYTSGKAGIGPFALNNAHHILTQLTNLRMVNNEFTEALQIEELGRISDYPTAGQLKGNRILDWLSAMINAFVDIAKDPYIVRLNVNSWTYNMASFLLRTGKGKQTFYFLCQPILKEMAQAVLKTKGKYGIDRTKTPTQLENEAIEEVLDKYDPDGSIRRKYEYIIKDDHLAAQSYRDLFHTYMDDKGKESSILRDNLFSNREKISGLSPNEEQVKIYYAWKALKPYADALANLVKYSKIDTKKTGKSFAEQEVYYNGMQAMEQDEHFEPGEISKFYDQTFIRVKTDNAIPFGRGLFSNMLFRCTNSFSDQKNAMLSLLGRKDNANAALLKPIIAGMEAAIKTEFFNDFVKTNNISIEGLFRGKRSMAKRIDNFKQGILRGNPKLSHLLTNGEINNDFVNYLIPHINKNNGLDFIDTSMLLDVDQASANNLINYWRELIDDPNPDISQLFKDLVVYAFYTSGDNPTMNAFFQYVPNSYKEQIGYTQFVSSRLNDLTNDAVKIDRNDVFLNNWQNDKLVKPVDFYDSRENPLKSITFTSEDPAPNILFGIRYGKEQAAIRPLNWIKVNGEKFPVFPPYIKIKDIGSYDVSNWHVYTLIGYNTLMKDRMIQYVPVYGLVSKKGYKRGGNTIVEYGNKTMFDFNKENVWDYAQAMENKEALLDMVPEAFKDSMESNISLLRPITDLPSYQNMNYARQEQDRVADDLTDDDYNWDSDENSAPLSDANEPTDSQTVEQITTTGFQGYRGGYSNEGKGTVQGDGKDKAMREIADGFIGELSKSPYKKVGDKFVLKDPDSSTFTSLVTIMNKGHNPGTYLDGSRYEGQTRYNLAYESGKRNVMAVTNRDLSDENWTPTTIMLARNSELKGQPLESDTKVEIREYAERGAKFVVGDMPDVDSQFIEYLQQIGATFTVYHSGNTPRVRVQNPSINMTFGNPQQNTQQTIQSIDELVTTDWNVVDLMVKEQEALKILRPTLDQMEITKEEYQSYIIEFDKILQEEHSNGNLTTKEQIEGVVNKFICNLR